MCLCPGGFRGDVQGVCLDEKVLSNMDPEEQAFWRELLLLSDREQKERKKAGWIKPYPPSDMLKVAYYEALKLHSGLRYCQIRQLSSIFDLSPEM